MLPSRETFDLDTTPFRARAGDLGARLESRRAELGLSRQDLARKLGTTVNWIVDLERSSFRWKNKSLIRVAAALEMPQIEVAIAAGVITDLPPYPEPVITNDGTTRADQVQIRQLLGWESLEIEKARAEFDELASACTLDELQFIQAVLQQMIERRC